MTARSEVQRTWRNVCNRELSWAEAGDVLESLGLAETPEPEWAWITDDRFEFGIQCRCGLVERGFIHRERAERRRLEHIRQEHSTP